MNCESASAQRKWCLASAVAEEVQTELNHADAVQSDDESLSVCVRGETLDALTGLGNAWMGPVCPKSTGVTKIIALWDYLVGMWNLGRLKKYIYFFLGCRVPIFFFFFINILTNFKAGSQNTSVWPTGLYSECEGLSGSRPRTPFSRFILKLCPPWSGFIIWRRGFGWSQWDKTIIEKHFNHI